LYKKADEKAAALMNENSWSGSLSFLYSYVHIKFLAVFF